MKNINKLNDMIEEIEKIQDMYYQLDFKDYLVDSFSTQIIDKLNMARTYMLETIVKYTEHIKKDLR